MKQFFSAGTQFLTTELAEQTFQQEAQAPSEMKESIKKLLLLPDKTVVLSGHGDPTTIEVERENLSKQI